MSDDAARGSVGFDRAAEFYDATRVLPPEVNAKVRDVLAAQMRDRGPCLEIGVGTGRIALPLAEAGVDLTGIDISQPMVSKLVSKSGGRPPLHLALADATRLPFANGSFGAGLAVHVLHLIPDWKVVVDELVRVVRPGGLLLFDVGAADPNRSGGWRDAGREIEERFQKEAGLERRHPGLGPVADLDRALEAHGAAGRNLDPITGVLRVAPGLIIRLFEENIFSWTWPLSEEKRRAVAASVRDWASEKFGDLEQPVDMPVVVAIRAYELPAGRRA